MATTNLDALNLEGALTVGGEIATAATQAMLQKFTETVAFDDFTDGGGATGTFQLAGSIPVGATVHRVVLTALVGFTGNTSATLTVGDGSDVDRYNTGTPSVFTTAANGLDLGAPSGVGYHATAIQPTLTITANTDFTLITAGSLTIEVYYYT